MANICNFSMMIRGKKESIEIFKNMRVECGKYELAFERCYDQGLYFPHLERIAKSVTQIGGNESLESV